MISSTYSSVDLEAQASSLTENVLIMDEDLVFPPSTMFQDAQKPAKKQTRQWAAWTRREEENFFSALRQVGKNFEKITCRVESKNKNQVRHYYYRLVRRMNKLLGPGLCIDAKNSKDTVAAMLRWWSLLEKFSCTASKLHLKPRRFKVFIEALENQLLKDRKKTRKKRPSGENHLAAPPSTTSKAPANDARPLKLLVDSQNTHKTGAVKGTSLKRKATSSANFSKGGLPTAKVARQKRRKGVPSTAYKKWEKAAMAGVSLVADAAEQLERAANDRNSFSEHGISDLMPNAIDNVEGQKDIDSVGKTSYCLSSPELVGNCSYQIREAVIQPSLKLKLQLFPMDEGTRQSLEKDGHNPHLELTLSARKRISSVLEHLNRKWGRSSIATGELMLLPYNIQQEDMSCCQRWTVKDTEANAGDVHVTVGSPPIFRLRYGWVSAAPVSSECVNEPSPTYQPVSTINSSEIREGDGMDVPNAENVSIDLKEHVPHSTNTREPPAESSKDKSTSVVAHVQSIDAVEPLEGCYSFDDEDGHPNTSLHASSTFLGNNTMDRNSVAHQDELASLDTRNPVLISSGDWADSLTTISVGDLLSEASKATYSGFADSSAGKEIQHLPFNFDSFDAAIAGHDLPSISSQASHASIWNAEETCDEFSFRMVPPFKGEALNPFTTSNGASKQLTSMASDCDYLKVCSDICTSNGASDHCDYLKDLRQSGSSHDTSEYTRTGLECAKERLPYDDKYDPAKDTCPTDIYWPDSLGPFELDMPSSRYQGQDLIFGDSMSLGELSRLLASSVDAFQNNSFFGMDKKDIPANDDRVASIILDNKVGSED